MRKLFVKDNYYLTHVNFIKILRFYILIISYLFHFEVAPYGNIMDKIFWEEAFRRLAICSLFGKLGCLVLEYNDNRELR